MSSSGKKNRKKFRPVPMVEVLPNAVVRPTTSWAEEVETELSQGSTFKKKINLPTAPRAVCDLVIDENKIPPNGPFMAYLSNLPYEITEENIASHFKELKSSPVTSQFSNLFKLNIGRIPVPEIENIQLPRDRQDRMRGFGYIEFKDKSSLLIALQEGELTLNERLVRISLPNDDEQNKDKGQRSSGSTFGRNRDMSDRFEKDKPIEWRTAAPIPHDPEKSVSKHSGGFTRLSNHRDRDGPSGGGPFRESRSGFNSDFDKSGSSFSRAFKDRDDRDAIRSSDRGGNRMFNKRFDREDRGSRSSLFGKKFDREDRDKEFKREPVAAEKEEPKTRPKIEIQPRSVPIDPNPAPAALPSSIFGGAKPVDTAKREMEIEMKLSTLSSTASVRGRGSSVSSTPTQNRSRSSSVSSLSGNRKREVESADWVDDASKLSDPAGTKNELHHMKKSDNMESELKEPLPPTNFWKQRSEATASCVEPKTSSSVIDNSETTEDATGTKEVLSQVEINSSSGMVNQIVPENNVEAEPRNSRFNAEKSNDSSPKWTTYSPYSQDNYDSNQQHNNRFSGNGNRFSENNKFSSFGNRDNRRDNRKDVRRDIDRRSDNRYFKNRDDNYGSSRSELGSYQNKWDRSRNGPFRNKNSGPGGSRRYDREDGRNNHSNYHDKNDFSSITNNRSSSSPISNIRDDNEFSGDNHEDPNFNDERLIDNVGVIKESKSLESLDDRLKTSLGSEKLPENANGNEKRDNSAISSSGNTKNLSELPELDDSSFSSGKSRKKDKKKKNQERIDESNEKEILKPIENERKLNNQKDDEKKNSDNHQTNDKSSTTNSSKSKDIRNKKSAKKSRDLREDVTQMPKQKEEKTPIFQDSNRYQLLRNDE